MLQAPVEAGLALELEALAAVLHDSGPALAGQLLSAAVADVWDSLSDRQLLAATGACRELLERERG
ncbi:hypothetical protein CEK28_12255 [Xenophilus sp. AP218F]|nr:hypothetical protein CEK28_12255 [Xenophilus sp. AP218F]